MTPDIRELQEKKLVGKHLRMTMAANRTFELWSSFMPRRWEINHRINSDMLSVQVYDADHDPSTFNADAAFDKWAVVEVSTDDQVPEGMSTFTLPAGSYAVFQYKGLPSEGDKVFGYIFGTWLPPSDYVLDHRPHFEVLGPKYKNNSPDSEEEIWIPVKRKE